MTMRTNYFLLFAILLGVIPMSYTHANDSIPKSGFCTPYTKSPYRLERQLITVLILLTTRTN